MIRLRFVGLAHTAAYAGGPRNRPPVEVGEVIDCDDEEAYYLRTTYPSAFEIVATPGDTAAAAPRAPEADRAQRSPSSRR